MPIKIDKNLFAKRSSLLTAFLVLFLSIIVVRLFSLQIVHGGQARLAADAQHSIYKKLLPSRGEIKLADKFNLTTTPVAANLKSYSVYAVPQDIINPSATAAALASVLELDSKEVLEKITQPGKKYVPLKKQLSDELQQKIKDLKLSGVYFDSEDARYYPEKSFLSQTLGFVGYKGDKKVGLYGLEKYFETDLAGSSGELLTEKDTTGAWIFGSKRQENPAQDGVDLILTIDKNIQFKAESVLKDAVDKNGADSILPSISLCKFISIPFLNLGIHNFSSSIVIN
jgi:cell division protein FtsI/penicillin-binding protein 2